MATPIDDGTGYYPPAPLKGYGTELFTLLYEIQTAVPPLGTESQRSLSALFGEASGYILKKAGGEHQDLSKTINVLAEIADKQQLLRKDAVATIGALYDGLENTDGSTDLTTQTALLKFVKDDNVEVRQAAAAGMKKLGVSVAGKAHHFKDSFAQSLISAWRGEKDGTVQATLGQVIAGMDDAGLTRIRSAAQRLPR